MIQRKYQKLSVSEQCGSCINQHHLPPYLQSTVTKAAVTVSTIRLRSLALSAAQNKIYNSGEIKVHGKCSYSEMGNMSNTVLVGGWFL